MPSPQKTAAPKQELLELRVSDIRPHPANPRAAVGNVDELAASIAEQGVLEPLLVVPDADRPGKYLLLAGHRRHAACRQAACRLAPALIRYDLTDTAAQVVTMLTENLQRADLTPAEEGKAYQLLLGIDGWSQKRIVAESGRAPSTVSARLKLVKLPDRTLAAQQAGQLSMDAAMRMAEFADEPAALADLEKAAARSTWEFDSLYKRLKRDRDQAREVKRAIRQLEKDGVPYVGALADDDDAGTLQIAPEAHEKCPGRAAVVRYDAEVIPVCAAAAMHHPDELETAFARAAAEAERIRAGSVVNGETPEEQAAREQREATYAAAAKARRDHLYRRIFDADADLVEGLAADIFRTEFLRRLKGQTDARNLVCELLGLDMSDNSAAGRKQRQVDLEQRLVTMTAAELVVLDDVTVRGGERQLEKDSGWDIYPPNHFMYNPAYPVRYPWRERLVDVYGWEWSPVEQAALDEGARRRAAAGTSEEEVAVDLEEDEWGGPTDDGDDV